MKRLKSNFQFRYVLLFVIFSAAWAIRYIPFISDIFPFKLSIVRGITHVFVFAVWGQYLANKVVNSNTRRHISFIFILIVFWIICKTIKYTIGDSNIWWYLYYFPMIFIPVNFMLLSLNLQKEEKSRVGHGLISVYTISAFLLAIILTNDYHNLVFRFSTVAGQESKYIRVALYYVVALWIVGCVASSFIIIYKKCQNPNRDEVYHAPVAIAVCLLLYSVGYMLDINFISIYFSDMSVVTCLFIGLIIESLMNRGLIQTNEKYMEIFDLCSVGAMIKDNENYLVEKNKKFKNDFVDIDSAALPKVFSDTMLFSNKTKHGEIYYQQNIGQYTRLMNRLNEANKLLEGEIELVSAENELMAEKSSVETRKKLIDRINSEIGDSLDKMEYLISTYSDNEEDALITLKLICILGTYIKRRCNMIVNYETDSTVNSMELIYALNESLTHMENMGMDCSLVNQSTGDIDIEDEIYLYDTFEDIIEIVLDNITSLLVRVSNRKNGYKIRLMFDIEDEKTVSELFAKYQNDKNIKLSYSDSQMTIVVDSTRE